MTKRRRALFGSGFTALAASGVTAAVLSLGGAAQAVAEDAWFHCTGNAPARVCNEEAQPTTTVTETVTGPTTTVTETVTETVTAPTATEPPPAPERLSGTFAHSGCNGTATCANWEKIQAFEDWRNKPAAFVLDYMGGNQTTWGQWTNPPSWIDFWAGKRRLHLSPGLWPKGTSESSTTFSLAAGARGDYDVNWTNLGKALVAQGQDDSIIRPGHEITGNWYSYTVCTAYKSTTWSATKAADAGTYFRRIVNLMRAVPGQHFTFEWNTSNGLSCAPPTGTDALAALYPGDNWVDYVGRDAYDRCFSPTPGVCADPVQRWGTVINGRSKLNDVAAFAALHSKPLFFSEYGINDVASDGFGDNPYFIQKMWEFFEAHPTAGESYFNVNSSDGFKHELFPSTQFPNARAKYLELFGG